MAVSDGWKRARGIGANSSRLRKDNKLAVYDGGNGLAEGKMAEGLMTPRQAATMLGVSYVTVKQWILRGSLKTVKTPGGHHRIEAKALEGFRAPAGEAKRRPQISGRNQLVGVVTEVTVEGLLARVRIRIGEQVITAIITSEAVREMKLKKGDQAAALVKATEVMVARV